MENQQAIVRVLEAAVLTLRGEYDKCVRRYYGARVYRPKTQDKLQGIAIRAMDAAMKLDIHRVSGALAARPFRQLLDNGKASDLEEIKRSIASQSHTMYNGTSLFCCRAFSNCRNILTKITLSDLSKAALAKILQFEMFRAVISKGNKAEIDVAVEGEWERYRFAIRSSTPQTTTEIFETVITLARLGETYDPLDLRITLPFDF